MIKNYELTLREVCNRRKSTRITAPSICFPFMLFKAWEASSNLKYSTSAELRSQKNFNSSILPNFRHSFSSSPLVVEGLKPPTQRVLHGLACKQNCMPLKAKTAILNTFNGHKKKGYIRHY